MATKRAPRTRRGRPPIGSDRAAQHYYVRTQRGALGDGGPALIAGSLQELEYHAAHSALVWMLRDTGRRSTAALKPAAPWVRGMVGRLQQGLHVPPLAVLHVKAVGDFTNAGVASCQSRADALEVIHALGVPVADDDSDANRIAALRRRAPLRRRTDFGVLVFGHIVVATLQRAGVVVTPSTLALVAGACGVVRFKQLKPAADDWERRLKRWSAYPQLAAAAERAVFATAAFGPMDLRGIFPELQPDGFDLPLLTAQLSFS